MMRLLALLTALLAVSATSISAHTRPKVKVTTSEYVVTGKTGKELMKQINRKGPRHGFLVRAIAQTQYTLSYGYEAEQLKTHCRVSKAWVELELNYVFPKLGNRVSADLASRWRRFMGGVRAHEEIHGKLATQMAAATERSMLETTIRGSRGCSKLRRTIQRQVKRIFDKYEATQRRFDREEHRKNGNVEALVSGLSG